MLSYFHPSIPSVYVSSSHVHSSKFIGKCLSLFNGCYSGFNLVLHPRSQGFSIGKSLGIPGYEVDRAFHG